MIQRNDLLPQILEKFPKDIPVKLFHIRNESNQDKDVWNDWLGFVDSQNNVWLSVGTTDPGIHSYVVHKEGAAHMCLGFHENIWVIDIHAANNKLFAHEALCSRPARGCKGVKYYRDANKNYIYDSSDIILDNFVGINCHRASAIKNTQLIGLYSEGCQVRQNVKDHVFFMKELKKFKVVQDSLRNGIYTYRFSCLLTSINDWKL